MTQHALDRLNSRVKPAHKGIASRLLAEASNYSSAALVATVGRDCSLVVIVRDSTPVTVMYSRAAQVNVTHLRVNSIVTL